MNASPLPGSRRQVVVAWLLGATVLAALVGVWGMTLGGIVAIRTPTAVATPEATFGARQAVVSGTGGGTLLADLPKCVYTQSDQGMLIVMSAATGSVLSPAQAANCGK